MISLSRVTYCKSIPYLLPNDLLQHSHVWLIDCENLMTLENSYKQTIETKKQVNKQKRTKEQINVYVVQQ